MTELNGYIKLHRKLIKWGWYQDSVVKDVFLHLLMTANFRPMEWQGRTIKAGQLITSYRHLANDLGFGTRQIRTAISKLSSTQEIALESTSKYTIITVVNWEEYQCGEVFETHQKTQSATNERHTENSEKGEQIMNKLKKAKKSTQSATSKEELETVVNSMISDLEEILVTQSATNERHTTDTRPTHGRHQRKNNKECKEGKEEMRARELTPLERELARRGVTMEHYLELKNQ